MQPLLPWAQLLSLFIEFLRGAGGPNVPLNSIVIYDGDYSQSNTQLTMTQQLQGFYDAAANPVSRLTHIVGSGQSNKFQTVYLGSGTNSLRPTSVSLWQRAPIPRVLRNLGQSDMDIHQREYEPIKEDSSYATTQVVPSMSNQGCVSWGAVIVSTTVKNSDGDGILDSWKELDQGYCDAAYNNGVCNVGNLQDPAWVDLPGAAPSQKDIFLQYDYMCTTVKGPPSSAH